MAEVGAGAVGGAPDARGATCAGGSFRRLWRPGALSQVGQLPALSFDQLLADAGYDSEANHRFCREVLGVESLIRAKARRSKTVVAKAPYRKEMCRVLGDPGDPVLRRQYRQRWKAETTMSVAKRKWGESLSARREELQKAQLLLRGVTYNLHRLVLLGLLRVRASLKRHSLSPAVGSV